MTKFVGSKVEILAGVYLVSQQARSAALGTAGFRRLRRSRRPGPAGIKNGKERLRVGDDGFTVHGRVVWHGRTLLPPASAQTPPSSRSKRNPQSRSPSKKSCT